MNGYGQQVRPDYPDSTWSSDGDWSLYLYAALNYVDPVTHAVGDYVEFYQEVDLTGVEQLTFDVKLGGGTYTDSYFAIDGQKLWTDNVAGVDYGVAVDVSGYSGVHELQLGVEVFSAFGNSADGWTHFDNITPEPGTSSLLILGGLSLLRRRQ